MGSLGAAETGSPGGDGAATTGRPGEVGRGAAFASDPGGGQGVGTARGTGVAPACRSASGSGDGDGDGDGGRTPIRSSYRERALRSSRTALASSIRLLSSAVSSAEASV
jgi:hypothetical protein